MEEAVGFSFHVFVAAAGKGSLGGEAAVERQPAAVLRKEGEDIHDFGLEGVKAVDAGGDEVGEQLVDISARVDEDVPAGVADEAVYAF